MHQHVVYMVKLGVAVAVGIVAAVVDEPELIDLGIDLHTSHDADALDDSLGVAAPLPAN